MSIHPDNPDTRDDALPVTDCPILRDLESYWQSLRHARHIPARSDIAPHQIDAVLPHAFILHRVAPLVARIRVAGQTLHDLLRMDARGMPISILFAPDSRDRLMGLVETAFRQPAIVAATLQAPAQMFRPPLTAKFLLLPLCDDHGQTSRLLGAIVTEASPGSKPRRFDLVEGQDLRIDSLASLHPTPKQKPGAVRPALRLVVNNA